MSAAAGPGKYDPECTRVFLETGAEGVLLIVLGGNRGNGFSVTMQNLRVQEALPGILREVANGIEAAPPGTP